jgi:hypothetical protein
VWLLHFKVKGAVEHMDKTPGTFSALLHAAVSNTDSINTMERIKQLARVESIDCLHGTRRTF